MLGNPGLALAVTVTLMLIVALIAVGVVLVCRRSARTAVSDADGATEIILVALLAAGAFALGLFVFYALFG